MADPAFHDDWINGSIPHDGRPTQSLFESDLFCDETSLTIPDPVLPLALPSSPLLSLPVSQSPPRSPSLLSNQLPLDIPLEVTPASAAPIPRLSCNPFADEKCPLRKRVKLTVRPCGRRVAMAPPRKRRRLQTTLYIQNSSNCTRVAYRIPGPSQHRKKDLVFTRRPIRVRPVNISDSLFERLQAVASGPPKKPVVHREDLPDLTGAIQGVAIAAHRFRQMNEGAVVRPVPEPKVRIQMGRKKRGKKRALLRFDDMKVAPLEPEEENKPRVSGLYLYINTPYP